MWGNVLLSLLLFVFIMLYIAGIILKLNKLEENLTKLKSEFEFKKNSTDWTINQLLKKVNLNEEIIKDIRKDKS